MTRVLGQTVAQPVAPVAPANDTSAQKQYGGIRRAPYWAAMILIQGFGFLTLLSGNAGAVMVGSLAVAALTIPLVACRLRNIGRSGWLALLTLVPIANLLVAVPCAVCPEGYQDTKRLDLAGRTLVAALLACAAVIVFAMVSSVA